MALRLRLRNVELQHARGARVLSFGEVRHPFGISGRPSSRELPHRELACGPIPASTSPALRRGEARGPLQREFTAPGWRTLAELRHAATAPARPRVPEAAHLRHVLAAGVERAAAGDLALLLAFPLTATGTLPLEKGMVTAGGVDLREVHPVTMESRLVPGLHFAGEVLDLDGDTGGYNLQAAFTTGHLAGLHAAG
jgi:hypothetical protein